MIRVFPRRTKWTPTDELSFVGAPPLFRPQDRSILVHVSCTFTWDLKAAKNLKLHWGEFYDVVLLGGPALDDPGGEFEPGRYIKEGVTITSRGCPRNCDFCYARKREGSLRELEIKPGHIVQDNNILACSREHIEKVFDMLRDQSEGANFNGGLDARLLENWHRELFDSIKVRELWFACDTPKSLKELYRVAEILEGIPQNKLRCYVMVGYGLETLAEAEQRLMAVYNAGFYPFCQLYRDDTEMEYSKDWRDLCRRWSRPAIYKQIMTGGEG